ncbi:MAG: nucleotidyl transferase AbiEii/AbiGii toxin family protein [Verrucomicrobia bacterium]|nr:nucleotidyl transferase AbiEii/AbiGii toxin family protein [Verrucomicrobiota bacterium]
MSSSQKRNLPASVRQRLLNLSDSKGIAFDLLLIRYAVERLLYRLTQSNHADRFLLKGAMLFAVWTPAAHRPTRDVDLLGFGSDDLDGMKRLFQELCEIPITDDGLLFDSGSVEVEQIREDARYGGLRVQLLAMLSNVKIPVQVDIGYGDVVTPGAETVQFPALLEFPAPTLRAYPVYTVVSEKFEAMVALGETNTRMKDFYDVWFLCEHFEFDKRILREAISGTFERRRNIVPKLENITAFSATFAEMKKPVWLAFLKRNALKSPELTVVINRIRQFIGPVLEANAVSSVAAKWTPQKGWGD